MRKLGFLFTFFAALAASVELHAAPVHIEVIVFSNLSESNTTQEQFTKPEEIISVEKYSALAGIRQSSNSKNIPVQATRLTAIARALERHDDYEILNYLSWVQEPQWKRSTEPVTLDIEFPDLYFSTQKLLRGHVSLFEVAQQLQFEVNAVYKPVADTVKEIIRQSEEFVLYTPEFEYELNERRRVFINDIHYFDHPKFGVIVSTVRPSAATLKSISAN